MDKIFVIVKRPGCMPETEYIDNTLEEFQRLVGGYIEVLDLATDLAIICNEEGRLMDLEYNCAICGVSFVGTIVLVRTKRDEFASAPSLTYMRRLIPQLWTEV
jgi:hypothetical protein